MILKEITSLLEEIAPLALQEKYDNAGLILGHPDMDIQGALLCIDVTESVIQEAIIKNCNLIISHHPLIFNGLKKITGKNLVERSVILAIKNNIAIYASHTNLDNVSVGVNGKIADKLSLINREVLLKGSDLLVKLVTFAPKLHAPQIRNKLFAAGAGHIGNYDSCSFSSSGTGSFKANNEAHPYVGKLNEVHFEDEVKIEVILPNYITKQVIHALIESHPYEEPAYDLIPLSNQWNEIGAGLIGELTEEIDTIEFLTSLKSIFKVPVIKHTAIHKTKIKKVAVCGGSGSFLLKDAISTGADIFISGDFKYHEYFEAENNLIIADIGHYESEQFTKEIFYDIIRKKMPTFAVQISEINTNPINYL